MTHTLRQILEVMNELKHVDDFKHLDDDELREFAIEIVKIETIKSAGQTVGNAVRHKELY